MVAKSSRKEEKIDATRGNSRKAKSSKTSSKKAVRIEAVTKKENSRTLHSPSRGFRKISFGPAFDPKSNSHLIDYVPPHDRPVRVYCDGIYDLFHYGHARSLEQAKKLFPSVHLMVGVCNDESTHKRKGLTVMDEHERAESLRHCKWVDEVIEDAPWTLDEDFLLRHGIDFVAHDDIPYSGEGVHDIYQLVKDRGQFLATRRTDGISTTDLVTRIVRNYDTYIRRNLSRGSTPRDLNLSLFKRGEIRIEQLTGKINKKLQEQRSRIKENWISTGKEFIEMIHNWEEKSQELVKEFTGLFDFTRIVASLKGSPKRKRNSSITPKGISTAKCGGQSD